MSQTTAAAGGRTAPVPIGARLDRMPITPLHRRLTAVIGVGLFFDTFENNLSGTIGKVLQSDFGFGTTSLKLVLASAFVGQFIGSLTLGRIADRFGRRRAFLVNLAIYSACSLLGAFAPNAAWLIVTRFLAGLGIGAEQALSDCYLADVLPASKRGRFIAWAYTLAFCGVPAVGFAALWLVPLSPLGVAGWRWLFVLGALGSAAVWVLRRQLIESPRWLAATGRTEEADRLVARMEAEAAGAGLPLEPPAPRQDTGAPARQARLRDIFRPGLLRRTLVLWVFCVLSVVGYYGFGTLAPQIVAAKGYGVVAGLGFTALSFLGYPVGSALVLPIVDRMERRTLVALSAGAMVVAGLGFAYAGSAELIVLCGFAYTLFSNVFSSVSHVYLSEQYPTEIRATAAGAAYSLSKLSAGALPFALLPVLDAHGPGALFAVIAAAMAVLAVTVLSLGERTTGVSLK
ncbi:MULTISPECIES: MFS transporter [unclassified Streptomyces]|uniref:MFS transporter n=1 Tax=unclassified Streptomyces TaxID=2593676 RepID=UPI000DBA68B8|nr:MULTISPECIES: MFS transporter [unclassified Streptomyces]MYU05076.1 MFS transporter [Streptomyces sp. SID8366]MYU62047.1 MFS transporter [Streptomyces sp. SID69]RAJ65950.1 putative MFS transporter [Streptomyces sp. PsTaAH-130]